MTAASCEVFNCRNQPSWVITTLSCLILLAGFEVSLIGRFSGVPRGPHKIRYYVERRDPEFERKMIEVLHVYKDVEIVNAGLVEGTLKEPSTIAISYDEKPGIQALAPTTPDLPPVPNQHPTHLRDYEYERLGTVSLLAGLDLHTGRVTEIVSDRHASVDFIALLAKLNSEYPAQARIRLLLDNHSAHISKETQAYLSLHPQRFEFVFTPKHGS